MPNPQHPERPLDHRVVAWAAAKLAVRSYARDPSSRNADEVQRAWARVRRAMAESTQLRMRRRLRDAETGLAQD